MSGKYGVLLADPPWAYRNGGNGAARNHYGLLSLGDLERLPVAPLGKADSVLFLWSTWPFLAEAMRLIPAWGYEFVSGLPWVKLAAPRGDGILKPTYGTGYWVRGCSEPLLIARRGKPKPPAGHWVGLLSEQFEHSRKPDNVYEIAETCEGPYLELFARRTRVGWDSWGDQVSTEELSGESFK